MAVIVSLNNSGWISIVTNWENYALYEHRQSCKFDVTHPMVEFNILYCGWNQWLCGERKIISMFKIICPVWHFKSKCVCTFFSAINAICTLKLWQVTIQVSTHDFVRWYRLTKYFTVILQCPAQFYSVKISNPAY